MDAVKRFESKFTKRSDDECWEWKASFGSAGYGQFWYPPSKRMLEAHRFAWLSNKGSIPVGLCVLHRCDNRKCVNPAHLFLGTLTENMDDMTAKGRRVTGERVGNSKLTTEDVLKIKADQRTQREIARDFGIRQTHVSRIKTGIAWRHLNA
jgi:hypothetical protein